MYPRFSETFILTEVLSLEEQGADLEIFSLRAPVDGHFHEALARVAAPVTYLPQAGRTLELWDALRDGQEILGGVVAQQLPELLLEAPVDAAQAVRLAVLVRERGIDHLHAHFGSVSTTVARLAARLAGITYSFTAHAKDIFHEEVDRDDMERKLSDAAAVVTVSDYNLDFLRTWYGPSAARVRRIYNGIDLASFAPATPRERPPVVVGVGRLVEKKGFDHLVDAIDLLVREGRQVRLDLIGTGAVEGALRAQVARLGLGDTVRFLGPLPQERIREAVTQAAVLAAPCVVGADGNRDGLPTVILESLALGTPVVATPVTGIPEAVDDEITGLLVPEGDAAALARAIARLLDDPELRCRFACTGRKLVEGRFDSRRNTTLLREMFHQVAARPEAARAS
jgi:glycosyltransferase involved in cell wall biosynthesis